MSAAPQMDGQTSAPASAPSSAPAPSAPAQTDAPAQVTTTGQRSNPRAQTDAQRARDAAGRFTAFKAAQAAAAGVDDDDEPLAAPAAEDAEDVDQEVVADDAEAAQPEAAAPPEASDDPKTWPEPARVAVEAAQRDLQAARSENEAWRGAGQEVHLQNLGLLQRLKFWQGLVEQSGINVDPRDLQILEFQIEQQARSFGSDLGQRRQEATLKQQSAAIFDGWKAEAQKLAASQKLDPQELLIRFANEQKVHHALKREGDGPSLADVARQMGAQRSAKQQQVNKTVPALLGKPTVPSGTVLKFNSNPQGWRDAMKARGHEID